MDKAPTGSKIGKTPPKLVINNARSSIKPRSAPDPILFVNLTVTITLFMCIVILAHDLRTIRKVQI